MPDIKQILCPVDFSEASAHAVEQATAIAGWYKARMTALHVYNAVFVPVSELPLPVGPPLDAENERLRACVAASVLSAAGAGVSVDIAIDRGQAATEILKHASGLAADLIVMGTHGTGGFERMVLGSVTEKVLRKAPCAVLTVPPRAHTKSKLPFTRLLCAIDFSEPSLNALAYASSLAQQSGAALTLLHVIEWPWQEPPAPVLEELPKEQAAALVEFRRYLEKGALARLGSLAPEAPAERLTSRISHGKAYVEILRVAADEASDLIVMGVHGRNALDLMVFGSTANHIVRSAACPVLTLRR